MVIMAKRRLRGSMEGENQIPKMSPTSFSSRSQAPEGIIQEGPLFNPENFTSLIQMVNQPDPLSFLKFARTGKAVHTFCYNAKEIQIVQMSQLSLSPPVEAPKAIIQNGPLFTPGIGDGLIKIVNQLDPISFLRFTRTCKPINTFCYNTKEIQVQLGRQDDGFKDKFDCRISALGPFTIGDQIRLSVSETGGFGSVSKYFSDENLETPLKQPFVFTIKDLYIGNFFSVKVDSRVFEKLSTFLRRFHGVRLGTIHALMVEDYNAFAQFIKEFGAKQVCIQPGISLPLELLPVFMNKVDDFRYSGHVPDDFILSATSKSLFLPGAAISQKTFKELLKRFHDDSDDFFHSWTIGRELLDFFNVGGEEEEHVNRDPFLAVCSELMEVVKVKEIDFSNMKPSVIYHNPDGSVYLLKSDGSIGKFYLCRRWVVFGQYFSW